MNTFLQHATNSFGLFIACLVFGLIYGLCFTLGDSWKEKIVGMAVSVVVWAFIMFPFLTWIDYSDYKKHYITCEKPVAKRAGYIFSGERCWKPTTNYIRVNEKSKTKQELLDAK